MSNKYGFKITKNYKDIKSDLDNYIEGLNETISYLREKLDTYNKDGEIQKLTKENEELCRGNLVSLSNNERKLAKEFSTKHYELCKSKLGCSYIITNTGIGTNITIRCNKCGEELDITDYGNW